jgi:hypothetical protein
MEGLSAVHVAASAGARESAMGSGAVQVSCCPLTPSKPQAPAPLERKYVAALHNVMRL